MNAAALLQQLETLLGQHAAAVRDGDADLALAVSQQLRDGVAALARAGRGLSPEDRTALQSLVAQCVRTQAMLARRQAGVEQALRVLDIGTGTRTYGPRGQLSATSFGARGFARA